jgi:fatty acid-binding protein DegV
VNLSTRNTAIVLDSTADPPDAAAHFPNWRVVPLYVQFGGESLRDGVDIDAGEFYARLRRETSVFPTTSQPTPGDFLACYQELGSLERLDRDARARDPAATGAGHDRRGGRPARRALQTDARASVAPERAAELEALVHQRRPHAELVVTLGAVIGAHAGPGTLALFWFRDGD